MASAFGQKRGRLTFLTFFSSLFKMTKWGTKYTSTSFSLTHTFSPNLSQFFLLGGDGLSALAAPPVRLHYHRRHRRRSEWAWSRKWMEMLENLKKNSKIFYLFGEWSYNLSFDRKKINHLWLKIWKRFEQFLKKRKRRTFFKKQALTSLKKDLIKFIFIHLLLQFILIHWRKQKENCCFQKEDQKIWKSSTLRKSKESIE